MSECVLEGVEIDVATRVELLYRRHRDDVYRLALRYGNGDGAWAEDITQDVFVSLCRKIDQLADLEDLGGWFYRVTHNRCLGRLRRNVVTNAPAVRWLLRRRAEATADLEGVAEHRQGVRRLFAKLETLAPKRRLAFCMYHIDGKELAEIGDVLGCSKSYACKLVKRAEAELRVQLDVDALTSACPGPGSAAHG